MPTPAAKNHNGCDSYENIHCRGAPKNVVKLIENISHQKDIKDIQKPN